MEYSEQCENCIHRDVCAYKEHYEDAMKLYKDAQEEATQYPWFKVSIDCVKYESNVYIRSIGGI